MFVITHYYVEDEYHVLMQCPAYEDLRKLYLNVNETPRNMHTFIDIMRSNNDVLIKLGCFITNMFKLRKCLLSSL